MGFRSKDVQVFAYTGIPGAAGAGLTAISAHGCPRLRRYYASAMTAVIDPPELGLRPVPPQYEQLRDALHGYALPAAIVSLEAFDANVQTVLRHAGDKPIRIGSKSVRCTALLRRVQQASPRFQGLLCFHAREAAWLAGQGFDDLLVAYPTVNPAAVAEVCSAIAKGHRITLMVDCIEHVHRLDTLAGTAGVRLPLCLDIDMSLPLPGLWFGARRSPVRDTSQALAVWEAIRDSRHVYLNGVMGYEAQIAGLPDADPRQRLRGRLIRSLKRISRRDVVRRRGDIVEALRAAGAELRFVNGGGSGSLASTAADPSVTEVTAGSAFFAPASFDRLAGFDFHPAAGFALEVARIPAPGMVTCHGGGYPASGVPGQDRLPSPWLPEGLRYTSTEAAGEVQTPLTNAAGLAIGDPVLFRHAKAGELCERFNELLLIADGRVLAAVPTYRGEGQAFL